jgi:hypothetical protein
MGVRAIASGVEARAHMGVSGSANGCERHRGWIEAAPRLGGSAFAPESWRVARRVIARSRSGPSDYDDDSQRHRDWVGAGRTMGGSA